ncbi:SET and MYND domain protein [Aspergillus avenaceus]|uniref:SET and MYND domain protein n=1 Tax=Aspergillus avenaceus TaxID=36643 RepID=A0A5N6TNV5_ASPAV|nr:SET and MYND domain protein [Aspergillus avenaceus]
MSVDITPLSVRTKTTPGPAPGGLGRGLFATSTIQSGEDILTVSTPFVAVLDTQRLGDTCSGCLGRSSLEPQDNLRACTACQVVKYCDKTCQAKDWKFAHQLECRIFQKLKPNILPNNARAMLRMVLRSKRGKYDGEELELFSQLDTHIKEIREENPDQWERISLSSKAVKAYSATPMSEEAIAAYGARLDMNAFNLVDAFYDRIGLYVHPYAAIINHDCNPNAVTGFDGDTLYIKALRAIQKDEQICITYIDVTESVQVRRTQLRDRYFFDCGCSKCKADLAQPPYSFLPNPSAQAPMTPDITEAMAHGILEQCAGGEPDEAAAAAPRLETTMRALHDATWPITHQPLLTLRDELINSLICGGRYNAGFIHAAIRYRRVDPIVYPSATHPVRQLHAWVLVRLATFLLGDIKPEKDCPVALETLELDLSLLIWSILSKIMSELDVACVVPGFASMVRERFESATEQFSGAGLDPERMGDEIEREWGKLEKAMSIVVDGGC